MLPQRESYMLLLLSMLMLNTTRGLCDDKQDLDTLRSQMRDHLTQGAPIESTVERHIETLRPDGTWPDVNYADEQRGGWMVYRHMSRILELAAAYRCPGHPSKGSPTVREAVERALTHWLEQDYRNSNWWYGRIGIPRLAAPILILMDDDLPSELRTRTMTQILDRSKMGMTGQNEVWVAGIAFMKGMLNDDLVLMKKARDSILSELQITRKEGIQVDMSFHQHGPQQQWGNYGSSFGSDMLKWSTVFRNTRFATDADQHAILAGYLTEGAPWIVWRGFMDVSGCGRQIFPGAQFSKGQSILSQLRRLSVLDETQRKKVDQILNSQLPGRENLLTGHKHYWRSDISVHRRANWYASVKMSSKRVTGAETCNSENLLGLHLGDGATYILCKGDEYEDVFPLWDWRRLPGTTCRQDDSSLVPSSGRCRGGSDFVGGVSNGQYGAAVLEYRRGTLRANKSWFFLGDQIVCLGSGISCDDSAQIVTSIEQSRLNGPISVSKVGQITEATPGSLALAESDWIHHANIGYRSLQPANICLDASEKTGDWRQVHDQVRGERHSRGKVFSLWVNHGASPQRADYAYAIYPDVTTASMPKRCGSTAVRVLQNTESTQALSIDDGKALLAVFYAPGQLALDDRGHIESDIPCVLLLDQRSTPATLYLADPTHKKETATLRISTAPEDAIKIALPQGDLAGSTVAVPLERHK